jgi:hypothetical protein
VSVVRDHVQWPPCTLLNVRVRLFPLEHEQVKNGASEADIWQTIDMFKERYSDYGSDRRSAIDFHVNQLEKVRPALSPILSFESISFPCSFSALISVFFVST